MFMLFKCLLARSLSFLLKNSKPGQNLDKVDWERATALHPFSPPLFSSGGSPGAPEAIPAVFGQFPPPNIVIYGFFFFSLSTAMCVQGIQRKEQTTSPLQWAFFFFQRQLKKEGGWEGGAVCRFRWGEGGRGHSSPLPHQIFTANRCRPSPNLWALNPFLLFNVALVLQMHYYRYDNAEVSCCYKYLMFTYNVTFWVSFFFLFSWAQEVLSRTFCWACGAPAHRHL